MEFVNAEQIDVLMDVLDSPSRASRKVHGTFRHDWDERNFPFDRHTLVIAMGEGDEDVRQFVYEPDTANTGIDSALQLTGWGITDLALRGSTTIYATTFGDPSLPADGSSEYSRLTPAIARRVMDPSGFFRLTAVGYAGFVFSLITYVMHLATTTAISPQVGLLAGALFAAAVNLVTASGALGSASGLTLVDKTHVLVLVSILIAAVVPVVSRVLVERGWAPAAIARLTSRVGAMAAISSRSLWSMPRSSPSRRAVADAALEEGRLEPAIPTLACPLRHGVAETAWRGEAPAPRHCRGACGRCGRCGSGRC
jgi:hypothetical protein